MKPGNLYLLRRGDSSSEYPWVIDHYNARYEWTGCLCCKSKEEARKSLRFLRRKYGNLKLARKDIAPKRSNNPQRKEKPN